MLLRRASPVLFALALIGAAALGVSCGGAPRASSGGTAGHGTTSGTGGTGAGGSTGVGFGGFGGRGRGQVLSLSFDPPTVTLVLDGTTPQMASFTLQAHYAGGIVNTVTPDSVQFDRPDLAAVQIGSPVVLTAPGQYAGAGTLHGIFQGVEATATLIRCRSPSRTSTPPSTPPW